MNRDYLISQLYGDYVEWCKTMGMEYESYPTFQRCFDHEPGEIDPTHLIPQMIRQPNQPLQPGDEERAVAEFERMLKETT